MMSIFSPVKRIFGSFPVFLAAFIIISLAADISYIQRKTTSLKGEDGWKGMPDFKVFWKAGSVVLDKIRGEEEIPGENKPLYDRQESFYHFRYSPVAAVAMAPFALVPYPRFSMLIFLLLGNAVFLSALIILYNHLKTRFLRDDPENVFMLWIMFLGTLRYYLVVISQGQTDGLAALLLVILLISHTGKKDILSGFILASILQIKPYFAPLGLYFILEKRYKTFVSFLLYMLLFAALPAAFLGLRETYGLTKDWLGIMGMSVPSQVLNYKNQSLSYGGALAVFKFTGISVFKAPETLVFYLSVFFTGMSMLMFFSRERYLKARDSAGLWGYFSLSFLMTVMVVFSPISWEAYYMALIIPLSVIFVEAVKTGGEKLLAFYLAAYFIVTLSSGTDITKFIPALNETRYLNVSSGAVIALAGMFHLYLCKKRSRSDVS